MTSNTLLVASDARVYEGSPDQNYGGLSKVSVSASPSRRSFEFFNQPFPLGVTVLSATLRMFQKGGATGGTRTVTVQRNATKWSESDITFNNRPLGTGSTTSTAQGNSAVDGRQWAFDVKTLLQEVADGAPWYGFRLTSDINTVMDFYAKEGGGVYAPVLEVEWSDAPSAPTFLSPAGGRAVSVPRPTFRFDFTDVSGLSDLVSVQVQRNATDVWTAPTFDSGEVASTLPQWTATADIAAGTLFYWRARVKSADGLWSDWSDSTSFIRTAKPTVAITNPPAPAGNVVYEQTPTFSWTVSATQQAYQLFIVDPDDPTDVLWAGNKTTSASTSSALPASQKLLLTPGMAYRLVLRVWDAVAREAIPEESAYVEVTRDFTLGTSGAVTSVTNLVLTAAAGSPFATATFKRAATPDEFIFLLGGKVIAVVEPADIFVSGTSYSYEVRGIPPRDVQTVSVLARVGSSTSNPVSQTVTTEPLGVWLYSLDANGPAICISNDPDADTAVTSEASEDTAVFTPPGSANPVLITSAIRGPVGDVQGSIDPTDLGDWETLSAKRTITLGMTRVDLAKKVQIYNTHRDNADELHGEIPIDFKYVEIR